MINLTAKSVNAYTDMSGDTVLMFGVDKAQQGAVFRVLNELDLSHLVDLSINKHIQRRSLDANAYAWVLMDKLAEAINLPKEAIYRDMVRNIGGNCETICVKSEGVNRLCEGWQKNGLGWITDTMPSKLDGCTNVVLYYGSSTYSTSQMSRLIDLLVQECVQQGIEVKPEEEVKALLNSWRQ